MKDIVPFRCAASGILMLVLLFLFQSASATESTNQIDQGHREITGEVFAAHAANSTLSRQAKALTISIEFAVQEARFVRLVIRRSHGSEPCLDEFEIYGPDSPANLALASRGAVPRASSLLPGYAIHAVAHLNDGLYGNDHSWIAATTGEEWAQIELPKPARVARVVLSRDRNSRFTDRQILEAEVCLSPDGQT